MRIIVCVKQIDHIYARTGMDPERYFLTNEDHIYRINPYDEFALEMALSVKENQESVTVSILTLGPIIAEKELKRCLAMGADEIIRIDRKDDLDPWGKSQLLARTIKDLGGDLVLCGKESLDKQNGQVGAFLAHHLGMPYVSAILDLKMKEEGLLRIMRSAGRGVREVIECLPPAVFSVDLGPHEPRLPTYHEKERAYSAPVRRLSYGDVEPETKVFSQGLFPPRPRPKRIPAPDNRLEAFDRIEQLITGSRVQKKGTVLDGTLESQVEGIMAFLKEHGFLKKR